MKLPGNLENLNGITTKVKCQFSSIHAKTEAVVFEIIFLNLVS